MLSRTVETFLSEYYDEIVTMASKICKGHRDHLDVAHYCMADFIEHPRAEELVHKNEAMRFLSGMMARSFNSSTSPYHKLYRQSGRVFANDRLFRHPGSDQDHDYDEDVKIYGFLTPNKTQREQMYKNIEHSTSDYDHEIDFVTEAILGILEEMKVSGNQDIWYMAVLFEMWLENPNYSDLSRQTKIPRTSISQAVQECREYVQKELKDRNIDI